MCALNVEERPKNWATESDRLDVIIAQLQTGFREWGSLKKKALEMALLYGSLLQEWKKLSGRRKWQKEVREKVTGADLRTCNRWKRIAECKDKVEDALTRWPGIKWGVVNMLKYLSGKFDPARTEGVGQGRCEPTAEPITPGDGVNDEVGVDDGGPNVDGETETDQDDDHGRDGATLPATLSFPFPAHVRDDPDVTTKRPKGKTLKAGGVPSRTPNRAEIVEYEVEIVKVLKVTVPTNATDQTVRTAFESGGVQFEISTEDGTWTLSDEGMPGRVTKVVLWG